MKLFDMSDDLPWVSDMVVWLVITLQRAARRHNSEQTRIGLLPTEQRPLPGSVYDKGL